MREFRRIRGSKGVREREEKEVFVERRNEAL